MLKQTPTISNYTLKLPELISYIQDPSSNPLMRLELSPGVPNKAYTPESVLSQNKVHLGEITINFSRKKSNYLLLGYTSKDVVITSLEDFCKLNKPSVDGEIQLNCSKGDYLVLLIGVGCKYNNLSPATYDISKFGGVLNATDPVYGVLNYGTLSSTLSEGTYKVWRLVLTPQQVNTLSTLPEGLKLGFFNASLEPTTFKNVSIYSVSIDGESDSANLIIDSGGFPPTSYLSNEIVILKSSITIPTYNFAWQLVLPSIDARTLTTSDGNSSLSIGKVDIGKTTKSKLQFRNVTATTCTITSIQITNLTQCSNLLTATSPSFIKQKVFSDFKVLLGENTLVECDVETGTKTIVLNQVVSSLDSLDVTIIYSPLIKIVATAAMITPYNPVTAMANATIINSNRKLQIQFFGYLGDTPSTPVPLGNPFSFKASV